MTELACEPSGFTRRGALNPWKFDCIPGGSSTGSAILVASGCCFAALGSDTGGSVRMPAHCCGVTALKSGYGKIPLDGAMALAPSLDSFGIFARSAADLALLWPVVSGEWLARHQRRLERWLCLQDAFGASDVEIAEILSWRCRRARRERHDDRSAIRISRRSRQAGLDRPASGGQPANTASASMIRPSTSCLRKRLGKGLSISDQDLTSALAARDALRDQFILSCLGEDGVAVLPVMPISTPRSK